jgi:DNA helicase-2/ATP-dependent DNA helicase PcrA
MQDIDFQKELNQEQYKVVSAGDGPHLVLAGAGSGKTRTLVYRVAWLLSQGVSPERILLVTFTNKAAREMMDRVRSILSLPEDEKLSLWGGTFHSLAHRLLRIYGKKIGIATDFVILDAEDSKTLIKEISKEYFKNVEIKHKPSVNLLREAISFAINSDISLKESVDIKFPEWKSLLSAFESIDKEYLKRKKKSKFLDFDDLLFYWKKLTLDPDIIKKFSEKWQYILVDEYQDTNSIQAEIIYNLAQKHQNIIVVGDDAQSIYSFRAADVKNILEFPDLFKKCKIHKLETNYRSSSEIVNLANEVIKENQNQFFKNLRANKGGFIKPVLIATKSTREEAYFVADKIEELIEDGMKQKEIAVLFRAANHSQLLEMELNRRGISYEMRGGFRFFERAHIKDVIAYLRIIHNIKDEISWARVLKLYEGIGIVTVKKIYEQVSKMSNLEDLLALNINISGKAKVSWDQFFQVLKVLNQHKNDKPERLLRLVIDFYTPYVMAEYTDYRQRKDDLNQLAFFTISYEELELFLAEVALQESFSLKEKGNKTEKVILSTVHQAKGLEWNVVFILNLSSQGFPHPRCVEQEEYEEERRLFYVAITRAKEYLFLSYPTSIYRYGSYENLEPSDFIKNISSDLLNYNELAHQVRKLSGNGVEYIESSDW